VKSIEHSFSPGIAAVAPPLLTSGGAITILKHPNPDKPVGAGINPDFFGELTKIE
jgi:hypothetical protein